MRFAFVLFALFLGASWSEAQPLTLREALAKARKASPVARQIRSRFTSEKWGFEANRALLRPQLGLNADLPGFTRAINQIQQPDGSLLFRPQSQNFSTSTLSLSQALLPTGGYLSLNSRLSRIDLLKTADNPTRSYWNSAPLFLSYSQPLFRINQIRWDWAQQKIRYEQASRQQLELLEDLNQDVVDRYFALLISQVQLQNSEFNLRNNDTIFRISQGRFGIGKIAENELLQVELGLMNARNAVEQNRLRMQTSEKELRNLLGETDVPGKIEVRMPHLVPFTQLDAEKAKAEARQNRSDYKSLELDENLARMNLRSRQISRRFTADLNLAVGFNQTATDLSSAYTNLKDQQSASVSIQMPLHNGGRNRSLEFQAQAQLDAVLENNRYQKNQIDIRVENQVLQIRQLHSGLALSAKADTIAQRRYQVAKNRYLIGKIDITDLSIAQNEKDEALLNYLETLRQYWMAWFSLRRATLFDFETGQTIFEP